MPTGLRHRREPLDNDARELQLERSDEAEPEPEPEPEREQPQREPEQHAPRQPQAAASSWFDPVRHLGLTLLLAEAIFRRDELAAWVPPWVVALLLALLALGVFVRSSTESRGLLRGWCHQVFGVRDSKARSWRIWWKLRRDSLRKSVRVALRAALGVLGCLLVRWLTWLIFSSPSAWTADAGGGHLGASVTGQVQKLLAATQDAFYKYTLRYFVAGTVFKLLPEAWGFITHRESELFRMRMNISLNVRQLVTDKFNRKSFFFRMRTVDECSIAEFLPGLSDILEEAMDHAIVEQGKEDLEPRLKGRFVTVRRNTAKQINDQIVNRLSQLFGTNYLSWDLGQAVQQKEYVYALSWEADKDPEPPAKKLVKKFRILLMEKARFVEMTTPREPGHGGATPGSARARMSMARGISSTDLNRLKWESCGYVCPECVGRRPETGGSPSTPRRGSACTCKSCVCQPDLSSPPCGRNNRCYGSDRIRDLIVLRRLLEEEHRLETTADETQQPNILKFDFHQWMVRGESCGGPKRGTWSLRVGDKVVIQKKDEEPRPGTWTVDAIDQLVRVVPFEGDEKALHWLMEADLPDNTDWVKESQCDLAPGYDFELDAQAEAGRRSELEGPLTSVLPEHQARRAQLDEWAEGRIAIAGSLWVAVPWSERTRGDEIVQMVSPLRESISQLGSWRSEDTEAAEDGGGDLARTASELAYG